MINLSTLLKNLKHGGYQRGLASVAYNFFSKNSSTGAIKSKIMPNLELAKELHKPIIKKIEKSKIILKF